MNRRPSYFIFFLFFATQLSAQVIDYKKVVSVTGNTLTSTTTLRIQVNSPDERRLGEISIPFQEGNEPLIHEASILDQFGEKVRTLRKKEIVTRSNVSNISFYENNYSKDFNLIWNEYPYYVSYSYSESYNEFLYLVKWTPMYYPNVSHQRSSLEVNLPTDYPVVLSQKGLEASISHSGNRIIYRWTVDQTPSFEENTMGLPYFESLPSVTMVPKYFYYNIPGSFESWESYGNWHYTVNKGKDELPEEEKKKVDKIIANATEPQEVIHQLYTYMQSRTKYVNVSIDEGGLVPYPASYVCYNGYGDCKALTIYMKALLKYAGIESNYCVVNAGENATRIDPSIPAQQFNHIILGVPLSEDTIWLENTSQDIPAGYLGNFTQNRMVLWVKEKGSTLVRTPRLERSDVEVTRALDYTINTSAFSKTAISLTLKGEEFESVHYLKKHSSNKKVVNYLKNELIDPKLVVNEDSLIVEVDPNQDIVIVRTTGHEPSPLRTIGNFKVITPIRIQLPTFEKPSDRKHPVRINYPINHYDSITYHLSSTFEHNEIQLPESILEESKFGKYSAQYSVDENKIHVSQHLEIYTGAYALEEYPSFFNFMKNIKLIQKRTSILINQ